MPPSFWLAAARRGEPALSSVCCPQVLYQVEGFVDKNNDLLYRDLSQAMWKAGHALIKSLFPEGNPAKVNLKRPPTAGSQFKASVATLMKNLQTKNPNYIRCFPEHESSNPSTLTESSFPVCLNLNAAQGESSRHSAGSENTVFGCPKKSTAVFLSKKWGWGGIPKKKKCGVA